MTVRYASAKAASNNHLGYSQNGQPSLKLVKDSDIQITKSS